MRDNIKTYNIIHSDLTGQDYKLKEVVRLVNIKQVINYMNAGAMPVDVYPSYSPSKKDGVLVFLFRKKDTKELYEKWVKRNEDEEGTSYEWC